MTYRQDYLNGETKYPIHALVVGQRVDLEGDSIADPSYIPEGSGECFSAHPEFQFEFETVAAIERETPTCIRVDFESGFSCGFLPAHMVDVDGEQ